MKNIRVSALLGCGTIGSFVLDFLAEEIPGCEPVAVYLRSAESRGRDHLEELGIPWVTDLEKLLEFQPNVVVTGLTTHEAMEAMGPAFSPEECCPRGPRRLRRLCPDG
ncbi:hypothetical protein MASR2M17_14410 [Aminivibrio sp.]